MKLLFKLNNSQHAFCLSGDKPQNCCRSTSMAKEERTNSFSPINWIWHHFHQNHVRILSFIVRLLKLKYSRLENTLLIPSTHHYSLVIWSLRWKYANEFSWHMWFFGHKNTIEERAHSWTHSTSWCVDGHKIYLTAGSSACTVVVSSFCCSIQSMASMCCLYRVNQ